MLVSVENPPIRDQLLAISTTICLNQFVVPIDQQNKTTVWWGNTRDFSPGIGLVTRLDRPVSEYGAQAVKSLLITYEERGETSVTVDMDVDPDIFEDDGLAAHVRDIFAQHLGSAGDGLVGTTLAMSPTAINPKDYYTAERNLDAIHQEQLAPVLLMPDGSESLQIHVPEPSQLIVPIRLAV